MMTTLEETLGHLRSQASGVTDATLDALFDELTPIGWEKLLGDWFGGDFKTGHRGTAQLQAMRWHGKRFVSRLDAEPLICRNPQGELYANPAMGAASLWMIEFRGRVSAAMVYDAHPIVDHFRQVNPNLLMGIMDGKSAVLDQGRHYYFWLERSA